MSIRQLFRAWVPIAGMALASVLALGLTLPADAQTTTTFSQVQALQAARNNLDVSLARRALAAAQDDVLAADHAPTPTIITKAASIDLQNGIGGGNLFSQKRLDKSIGVD